MTDFTIISRPVYITLTCPYCGEEIKIKWADVDVPGCWSDDWGFVDCPECKGLIELGDYTYD